MGFFENRTPEIIKQWNDMTWLVMDRGSFYVCKVVSFEDLELYKKLVEIDSPYIARVYDVTLVQDRLCAVQEYIQGETLEEYLQEKGPLTEQVVCDVTLELLEGLGAMHDRGIIHRDLTPKNIIVTGDDHIKVIDFGISRVEKAGASTDTEFLGTAGFAAPEQYGFRQTSPRTDIYAVGVLMNYMLTLKIPNEELVEGTLRPIIEKCTRMDEADRYQSVEALQAVLSAMQPNPLKQARPQTGNWLPGFRHGVQWHKVVAGIYYFFALQMLLVGAAIGDFGFDGHFLIPIATALMLLAPVLILFNTGNWLQKFPLTKDHRQGTKMLWQGIFLALAWLIAIILIVIV